MPVDHRPKAVMRKIILHTEAETVGMADCHFLQGREQCRRCHRAAAVNLKIMYGLGCFTSGFDPSCFPPYSMGEINLAIASRTLNHHFLRRYHSFVISTELCKSFKKSSSNILVMPASYMKALTSKFKSKLRISIFADPTEATVPSIVSTLAWIKPFSY